jgi:hypothetical protein
MKKAPKRFGFRPGPFLEDLSFESSGYRPSQAVPAILVAVANHIDEHWYGTFMKMPEAATRLPTF